MLATPTPQSRPSDLLFDQFAHYSELLPQTQLGVVNGVGLAATRLFMQGDMTWSEFIDTELEGDPLERLIEHEAQLHDDTANVNKYRQARIFPAMYELTKAGIVSSLFELQKGRAGQRRGSIQLDYTGVESRAVEHYLFDVLAADTNRDTATDLFAANVAILDQPAFTHLSADYHQALDGISSTAFRRAEVRSVVDKRHDLAEQIRPRFEYNARRIERLQNLSGYQLEVFAYNASRP